MTSSSKQREISQPKLKVVYKNPVDLIPYVNNAKKHGAAQILALCSSIKEFGFNNPVLLDGANGLIAGHGRLQAAIKLGLDAIPTIDLSHLSGARKQAYILADNRLSELDTSWDFELLKVEVEAIHAAGMEVEITGFSMDDFLVEETEDVVYEEIDDPELEGQANDLTSHALLAIQIEFKPEDYDVAYKLINQMRDDGIYVGGELLQFMKDKYSAKHNKPFDL